MARLTRDIKRFGEGIERRTKAIGNFVTIVGVFGWAVIAIAIVLIAQAMANKVESVKQLFRRT